MGGHDTTVGSVFGRYMLLDLLGTGGTGTVYAAFDPKLDRKVALKLVWSEGDAARAAVEREARLAARLQHPNVIAIYDVGAVSDPLYVAMEHVDGVTLARWIRGTRRSCRDVAGVFVQAARGLAAAHAAGLVHRDFKPSNVLVGRDGRVRVLDFGLARAVDDLAPSGSGGDAPARMPIGSRSSARAGTPAYMAPEQHRGEHVGPAADQFAFCVALHEALYGVAPFGDAPDQLSARVRAGRVVDPPRGARVPSWLRSIVLRGLRVEPEARFPSMDALAEALGRDPTQVRRLGLAAAALAGAIGIALVGHATAVHRRGAACDARVERIAALVGPPQAQRVRDAFAATGVSYAATSADRSLAALDRYARGLGASDRDACLADRPELAGRVACLDGRAAELAGVVEVFAGADRSVVARAIGAAEGLSSVAACDDASAAARPDDASGELAPRIAHARALYRAGRFAAATDEATRIAGDARTAGARRAELDAAMVLGEIAIQMSKPDAPATLGHAIELGEALGRDADVESGLELLAFDRAQRGHDFAAAHLLQQLATAKLARTGRSDRRGDLAALDGAILQLEGRLAPAEAALRQAIALQEATYGADNPLLGATLDRLAAVLVGQGREAEALPLDERAAAIRERVFGPDHPRLVSVLVALGSTLSAVGRHAEARDQLLRADAIAERAFGVDSAERFYTLDNLGIAEKRLGHHDAAQAAFAAALAITEARMGRDSLEAGQVLEDLGEVATARGDPAGGIELYERALPIVEHALGADHREVGELLSGLGEAYLAAHRPDPAVAALDRALRLRTEETPAHSAPLRFALARALWDAGRDRPRALALAREAAGATFRSADGVSQADVAAWLEHHRLP